MEKQLQIGKEIPVSVTLSAEAWGLVLGALDELPRKQVEGIYSRIMGTVQAVAVEMAAKAKKEAEKDSTNKLKKSKS